MKDLWSLSAHYFRLQKAQLLGAKSFAIRGLSCSDSILRICIIFQTTFADHEVDLRKYICKQEFGNCLRYIILLPFQSHQQVPRWLSRVKIFDQ